MTKTSSKPVLPLSLASLPQVSELGANVPDYRINKTSKNGIVHLGPGAFFRGHQAWYTHKVMEKFGGDWGITAVSMRSAGVKEALQPQDGLYSLVELDKNISHDIVGSITDVLVLGQDYDKLLNTLTSPDTHFVTMTITEKGYCLDAAGMLDKKHPDIIHDLSDSKVKTSAIGLLSKALELRFLSGTAPFCAVSCDNLTDNGKKLKQALVVYTATYNLALSDWLDEYFICPSTMVDSITPATDDALRKMVADDFNVKDNWPIKRESFVQWVIEDCLPEHRPAWDRVGAILTNDVHGFEAAKLRLLNCPHSTLAYLGVLMGIETVFDAMQHTGLVAFITDLMDSEIIPSLTPPKELNPTSYSRDILDRFRNPTVKHLLSQIAWDGSQKLPMRILPIIQSNLTDEREIRRLCYGIAAWILFVRHRYTTGEELVDPLAAQLLERASQCNDDAENDVSLFLDLGAIFPDLLNKSGLFKQTLVQVYAKLVPLLKSSEYVWF
ncbi:mannitol dehydrogenase family protein [Agaribacter marinus]|uniref:Mannitol 2-dehydrogenase n=1 Tax=Agaribacter marinus TaxID=1431249 RepID=A0AA37T1B4_9ALTE|nr:mannitol dehydrogenase family protein [Agaribacter marinus]GLR69835.1 mannitol 2-dehydrogenase [Agaribacter marinus]